LPEIESEPRGFDEFEYTEADLRKAFEKGYAVGIYLADYKTEEEWSKFIQSLKPSTPKWFEAEVINANTYGSEIPIGSYDSGNFRLRTTIINDKKYLVGTYQS